MLYLPLLAPMPMPMPCCAQVSDKERKVELDTLFRDVASVVSEKCINPEVRPLCLLCQLWGRAPAGLAAGGATGSGELGERWGGCSVGAAEVLCSGWSIGVAACPGLVLILPRPRLADAAALYHHHD